MPVFLYLMENNQWTNRVSLALAQMTFLHQHLNEALKKDKELRGEQEGWEMNGTHITGCRVLHQSH